MAGVLPDLVIGIGCLTITYYYAKKLGIKGERCASMKEIWEAAKKAALALIIGMFVFKEFGSKDLPKVFIDAAASSVMCLLIVAAAGVFSWIVA